MNYAILIIIALAGIALGMYIARRGKTGLISEQAEQKTLNKQKILDFIQANGKIQNNDVEKLAGVSNATAERYLDELEKEGKLTQHGSIGQNVFYTPMKMDAEQYQQPIVSINNKQSKHIDMTPSDPQKTYLEFQERFNAMSDEQLIDAFNSDVGKSGWVSTRASFHTALREEFEKRHYDFSAIGGTGRLSWNKKVKLIEKRIVDESSD